MELEIKSRDQTKIIQLRKIDFQRTYVDIGKFLVEQSLSDQPMSKSTSFSDSVLCVGKMGR